MGPPAGSRYQVGKRDAAADQLGQADAGLHLCDQIGYGEYDEEQHCVRAGEGE